MFSGPQGLRVLSVAVPSDQQKPVFFVMLNGGGQVGDFLKLSFIMKRWNSNRAKEREKKVGVYLTLFMLGMSAELISLEVL